MLLEKAARLAMPPVQSATTVLVSTLLSIRSTPSTNFMGLLRTITLLAAAASFLGVAAAQDKPAAPAAGEPAKPAAAAAPAAPEKPAYAGSETCQACHEDIYNAFLKSPHHVVETS